MRRLLDCGKWIIPRQPGNSLRPGSNAGLRAPNFGPYVEITSSFTLEGWIKRTQNPTESFWHYILGTRNAGDGWIFTIRMRDGLIRYELYGENCVTDGSLFDTPISPDDTNAWHHLALVYDHDAISANRGVWELFLDSESYGTVTNYQSWSSPININGNLFFNDRLSAGHGRPCEYDYWRVSDCVLTTNEFLNAPQPEPPSSSSTLAYWKLGMKENGFFDSKNYVGDNYAVHGYQGSTYTTAAGDGRQAFDEVPNTTVSMITNHGSINCPSFSTYGYLLGGDLGLRLEVTNSFTVEGWYLRDENPSVFQYLFGTRFSNNGWLLQCRNIGGKQNYVFYAEDESTPSKYLVFDKPFNTTDDAENIAKWQHLALTYDHTLSNGVWEFFLNGVSQGTLTNAHAVTGTSRSTDFYLGGRPGNAYNARGSFDCWRVCSTVLTPAQFLNATAAPASVPAQDVLAFWPLDNDGLILDAVSTTGDYSFLPEPSSTYRLLANADQAVAMIPNPEPYDGFRGDPVNNAGSLAFYQPGTTSNNRAHLLVKNLGYALELDTSFTIEAWTYRTGNPSGWYHVFNTRPLGTPGWLFSLNNSDGKIRYNVYAGATSGGDYVSDVKFPDSDEGADLNVWRHVALTYNAELANGVWEVFVDSVSRGTVTNVRSVVQLSNSQHLQLGGRSTSANSFEGSMDSARVTRGVLSTNEFLNAMGNPPLQPPVAATAAYWKLDSDGVTKDVSSQVEPRYSLTSSAEPPLPSTELCRSRILNPDTTGSFIGDPKTNLGSVQVNRENDANRYLTVKNLGNKVELSAPFTVEGWLKRTSTTGDAVQVVTGTQFDTAYGWLLTLEERVAGPVLRLQCKTDLLYPLVDAEFDCAGVLDNTNWHHIALVYTPWQADKGMWELFADGVPLGQVYNSHYAVRPHGSHRFLLGGRESDASFNGLLDCWRVSSGALTPEGFLYYGYLPGTVILVR
jgi:hypothetical protein